MHKQLTGALQLSGELLLVIRRTTHLLRVAKTALKDVDDWGLGVRHAALYLMRPINSFYLIHIRL